jgi:CubicO group peptidase (beta-lactamase class C family)
MLAGLSGVNMRMAIGLGMAVFFAAGLCVLEVKPFATPQADNSIDAILSADTRPDAPGFAAVVKNRGRILFEKGYGVRELSTGARIDPQTNFRLASFTKQFTATAIMLLVHDGKLQYDDHLADIFPDFPTYGRAVTIRHLLTHTSGLPDYETLMEREEKAQGPIWSAQHQIQDAEVLSLLEKQTAGKFAPGTSWDYSNSGYVILGLIIAKVAGMSYREFLYQKIFSSVGMNHTVVYQKGVNEVSRRALGYSREKDAFVETDQSATSATLGDGGIYSNVVDLGKWDEALQKHTLLSEKEMLAALTPVTLADGSEPHWPKQGDGDNLAPGKPVLYGYGWFLDPYEGHPRMWHSGTSMGFRTVIERFPSDSLTIIILSNRTDLGPAVLSEKIAAQLLPQRSSGPPRAARASAQAR